MISLDILVVQYFFMEKGWQIWMQFLVVMIIMNYIDRKLQMYDRKMVS